ncbi:histidine phosphatase family protein [Paludibacterium yongneupense]|uniref:histidine phosphatase family protein n=1 Tax=Paludibacterium yongneupense TaxID=400061 RepID=UPI0004089163|nr:histidine phosphatase family protein [Paludibacterium yongneupense]
MTALVYLLRHGDIGPTAARRYIGQTDLPLSIAGRQQAQALASSLAGCRLDAIYASDLCRAQLTARIVAAPHGLAVETRRDLREIALGDWEGLARHDVAARFPEAYAARGSDIVNFRPAGGESFADVRLRALRVWREILASGNERVAVVAHAGINRVVLCHALGLPLSGLLSIAQRYACINVLRFEQDRCTVEAIDCLTLDCCHEMTQQPPCRPVPVAGEGPDSDTVDMPDKPATT